MKKRNKYVIKGIGEKCNNCGAIMERRMHKPNYQLEFGRKWYFSEWDVCDCGMVQHYEKYKVYNTNTISKVEENVALPF